MGSSGFALLGGYKIAARSRSRSRWLLSLPLIDQVTNNKEWYDPRSVTTDNGALKVSFTRAVGEDHGLNYTGGSES